jgi:hypothetical protein
MIGTPIPTIRPRDKTSKGLLEQHPDAPKQLGNYTSAVDWIHWNRFSLSGSETVHSGGLAANAKSFAFASPHSACTYGMNGSLVLQVVGTSRLDLRRRTPGAVPAEMQTLMQAW